MTTTTTTTRRTCVLLCLGALIALVPGAATAGSTGCAPAEVRQVHNAQAAAYLVAQSWEPTRAAATVGKLNGRGPCG